MKLLVVDGNSILNRAFYGIKHLSTKDGRSTNGIYGFLNIFLSLVEKYTPDCAAVAFDLKAPTFRHKMYDAYKAGRRPSPPELREQFEPLKEILTALGYSVVEKEGYEADDILGTLSHACSADDFCYIVTGDRDSLQLVRENVNVLLATTRMGQTQTTVYDVAKIREDYLVEAPEQLIDIKAIQGDTSDNIPGVAGIGEKGAKDLISKFGSLDRIYNELETLDIKPTIKIKLEASRESAYLSRTLGTICLEAPVSTNLEDYAVRAPDAKKVRALLSSLELFKILAKINLDENTPASKTEKSADKRLVLRAEDDFSSVFSSLREAGKAYFIAKCVDGGFDYLLFKIGDEVVLCENSSFSFGEFTADFLSDETIEKYTDDTKSIFNYCDICGISPANIRLDTSLAAYLLNPNSSDYGIKTLASVYSLDNVKVEAGELSEFYASESERVDAAAVMEALSLKLCSAIKENEQEKLLYDIEIPLARVLAAMEREGFSVDRDGIENYGVVLGEAIAEKLTEIYNLAGCEFNVNSPKQLGEVLFSEEHLHLPHGKKTKNGYSTSAEVLEFLRDKHPVIDVILEYRSLTKLKSTYCDGLLKVIDNDGRIHSTLNQTETRTGRISSAEPNLQNIPVRTELGRELRRFFNAREGFVLIDADYSQIELRVLAALADDKNMKAAFINGEDIHTATASQVFNLPPESVTPLDRRRAKAVNFGIVYGIGAFSLSKDIGVSVAEADRYIKGYLANYSGVARFMESCKEKAKALGYAETVFGRRRYLPELTASNANIRSFGERVAMNMPIQGTAADIIKIAMIRVFDRLKKEAPDAHLIMQVHDELLIEAPEEKAEAVAAILNEEMENAVQLGVPFTAEVNCGKTWYDTK